MSVEAWLALASIGVTLCLFILTAIGGGVGWIVVKLWNHERRLTALEPRRGIIGINEDAG